MMTNYFPLAKIELGKNFKTTTTCHKRLELHHNNNKDDEDSNHKDGDNNISNNNNDDDVNHGPWPTERLEMRQSLVCFFFCWFL